jgi:hypothetical protein
VPDPHDPLDARPLAVRLHALAGARVLSPQALERALERIGRRPSAESWYRFARFQLIILGTVLAVVGAIFFVAANWDVFPPQVRIGLVAAAMAITTLAGGWIGLDKLSGRAAALAGGLLFGPLMAVVGQVYQTGADAYELFLAWSLVLAGYALAARFVGAWIVALLLGVITSYQYIDQALGSAPSESPGLWVSIAVGASLTALALVRRLRHRGGDPLGVVALALGWMIGFCHGVAAIVGRGWPPEHLGGLALALALAAATLYVGRRLGDLGYERAAVALLFGLLTVAEGKLVFDTLDLEFVGLLVMGFLLSVQGYVGGEWIKDRRVDVEAEA